MSITEMIYVRLCTSCRSQAPRAGFDALIEAFSGMPVEVLEQSCMNGCAQPVSMALQSAGRATCFFSDVDVVTDRDDIVGTVRAYRDAPAGWIEDARPCGRLRFCLKGRVPAL